MGEMLIGVILAGVMFAVLAIGFGMGKGSAATDCKHYGAFREAGVTYDCKQRSAP